MTIGLVLELLKEEEEKKRKKGLELWIDPIGIYMFFFFFFFLSFFEIYVSSAIYYLVR